jgi:5-methylcytosine-specific restriction endonuclease McrA
LGGKVSLTKFCRVCGAEKPLQAMQKRPKNRDGYDTICKSCSYAKNREWAKTNPEKRREIDQRMARRVKIFPAVKICFECKLEKPAAEFHKDKYRADGLKKVCRKCISDIVAINNFLNSKTKSRTKRLIKPRKMKKRTIKPKPVTRYILKRVYYSYLLLNGKKYCPRCREEKLVADFPSDKSSKDGLSGYCKKCRTVGALDWVSRNLPKKLSNNRRRQLDKINTEGFHTEEEWTELKNMYHNACLKCGATNVVLTRDHIVPPALGGTDWISNIQPLCRPCNSSKGQSTVDYRGARV